MHVTVVRKCGLNEKSGYPRSRIRGLYSDAWGYACRCRPRLARRALRFASTKPAASVIIGCDQIASARTKHPSRRELNPDRRRQQAEGAGTNCAVAIGLGEFPSDACKAVRGINVQPRWDDKKVGIPFFPLLRAERYSPPNYGSGGGNSLQVGHFEQACSCQDCY
jgi:hypothetical protein